MLHVVSNLKNGIRKVIHVWKYSHANVTLNCSREDSKSEFMFWYSDHAFETGVLGLITFMNAWSLGYICCEHFFSLTNHWQKKVLISVLPCIPIYDCLFIIYAVSTLNSETMINWFKSKRQLRLISVILQINDCKLLWIVWNGILDNNYDTR